MKEWRVVDGGVGEMVRGAKRGPGFTPVFIILQNC